MDAGDSAFFAWAIGWERHALAAPIPHACRTAPIFHPLRYTLGIDEPILGTTVLVAAPGPVHRRRGLALQRGPPVHLPALRASPPTCSRAISAAGRGRPVRGRRLRLLPHPHGPDRAPEHAGHPVAAAGRCSSCVRYFTGGRWADALLAGLLFALATYACGYHGLIGLAVLPPAALILLWGRWRLLPGALAGGGAGRRVAPPAVRDPQARARPPGIRAGHRRDGGLFGGAGVLPGHHLLEPGLRRADRRRSGPPTPTTCSRAWCCPCSWWEAGVRSGARAAGRAATPSPWPPWDAAAALVALGPELRVGGQALGPGPFALARELVPPFRMIRVPSRAGIFIALALAMLAAKALALLAAAHAAGGRSPRRAGGDPDRTHPDAGLGAGGRHPAAARRRSTPGWPRSRGSRWSWSCRILDIYGIFQRPAYHESIYLVHQTRHWKPPGQRLRGHRARALRQRCATRAPFPSRGRPGRVPRRGRRYVILHRGGYGPNQWARHRAGPDLACRRLEEVARFDAATPCSS